MLFCRPYVNNPKLAFGSTLSEVVMTDGNAFTVGCTIL